MCIVTYAALVWSEDILKKTAEATLDNIRVLMGVTGAVTSKKSLPMDSLGHWTSMEQYKCAGYQGTIPNEECTLS